MLAMAVAGILAKQGGARAASNASAGGGGLGDPLGGLLGGQATGVSRPGGGGGLASMLDLDGDGNPLDDILNMARRALRQVQRIRYVGSGFSRTCAPRCWTVWARCRPELELGRICRVLQFVFLT
jgi:hypothetical protein